MTPVTMVKKHTDEESRVSGVAYEQLSPEKQEIFKRIKELEEQLKNVKGTECEVYSRIVGYFRPVKQWNEGKQAEFNDRIVFDTKKSDVLNDRPTDTTGKPTDK
jgi:hypothetical protein